jgi:hypothetical protein
MNKNTGLAAELPSNLQAKFVEAGVGVWTGAFCRVVWCAGSGGWVTQCGVVLEQFVGVGDIDEGVEFQNIFSVVMRGQSPHTRRFDVTG